jgi:membrane protein YqaA with SNARE-associated domain
METLDSTMADFTGGRPRPRAQCPPGVYCCRQTRQQRRGRRLFLADVPIYVALFVTSFLAATILPLWSEALLGTLTAVGRGDLLTLFLVATAGNTLGSVANWGIGRGIAHYRDRPWFPVSRKRYEAASRNFARYGLWSLLFAWLPLVGDPLTVVAGALRVPFGRFLLLVAIGKAARYAALMAGVGWWMGG